jgi:peptidoglycan/LPS O-acetylase OafA/YrhL
MPKMKLGAAFYAVMAVLAVVSAVLVFRGYGAYADADQWYLIARGSVFLLIGVMFGIGAVTRRGLMSAEGPRICRSGWIVVIALLCAEFVVYALGDDGWGNFPSIASIFIPPFVQRLQDKYYEGRQEAERELNPEAPDGVRPPTV